MLTNPCLSPNVQNMLRNMLHRYGVAGLTFLSTVISVMLSLAISSVFISLFDMPKAGHILALAAICSSVVAPPVAYVWIQVMAKLDLSEEELRSVNMELQSTLTGVKELRGLIPICSACKKIRDDKGYWNQLECYIEDHSRAEFTHGICPGCLKERYPDLADGEDERAARGTAVG